MSVELQNSRVHVMTHSENLQDAVPEALRGGNIAHLLVVLVWDFKKKRKKKGFSEC